MLLDDALADREAQAGALALRLGAEERLEHPLGDGFGHSGAVVRNADRHAIQPVLGGDRDATVPPVRASDRLGRVVDDVHEHLLDLVRVHLHLGDARFDVERELDLVRHELVLEQSQGRLEDGPDGLQLTLSLLATREREQVAHDARGPLGLLPDDRQRLGEARRHVGGLAQQIAEPHDRCQRIVEVVRDARDQLTDRGHFLGLQELLLEPAFLGLVVEQQHDGPRLARGDGGDEEGALARAHVQRRGVRGAQQPRHRFGPGGGEQGEPRAAGDGGDGEPDQIGEDAIRPPHDAPRVDEADRLRDGVHGLLPLAFAAREQLDEPGVLQRDGRLGERRAHECEGGIVQRAGALALERDGADRASHRHDRGAEPARGLGLADRDVQLLGARGNTVGKDERPAPQRELQQRVVGGRGSGAVVVRHGEPVRVHIEQHDGQPLGGELLGDGTRHQLDDGGGPERPGELLGEPGEAVQHLRHRWGLGHVLQNVRSRLRAAKVRRSLVQEMRWYRGRRFD